MPQLLRPFLPPPHTHRPLLSWPACLLAPRSLRRLRLLEAMMQGVSASTLLLPLLLAEAATAAEARPLGPTDAAAAPSGTLLWSNVSEAGMGLGFGSALALPGGDVLLPVPSDCKPSSGRPDAACGARLGRLHPPTGELAWSVAQPDGEWSLALAGGESAPIVVAWTSGYSSSTAVRALDTASGKLLWEHDHLSCSDMPVFAVSGSAFLGAGTDDNALSSERGVRAIALSLADGSVLLNETVAKDTTTSSGCNIYGDKQTCRSHGCAWGGIPGLTECQRIDWYADSVALANESSAGELALIGTEDGDDAAEGLIVALSLADGSTRWTTRNVTATKLHVVQDVVVATVDTRPLYGQDTKLAMLRGFSLADGQLLWQRTTKRGGDLGPIGGVALGRACDIDCSLPCELIAAGAFGAIDSKTGRTVYNLTKKSPPLAIAQGVAYYVHQPQAIGRTSAAGRGAAATRNGPGTLVAAACGGDTKTDVLWSALLPVGDDGGSAPFKKVIVSAAAPSDELGGSGQAQPKPVVLVGGHDQGPCFRGHCEPSHSAIAAFAPPGVVPPPIPPPPPAPGPAPAPSQCQDEMRKDCAAAREVSADKCEVCCGEHAHQLQKVGCVEDDFEVFCHTATCDPSSDPPQICPKSGVTCPRCGRPRCDCPAPPPPPP